MKVSIIGSGVYAKAISTLLLASSCTVTMWTEKKDFKEVLAKEGTILTNSYEEVTRDAEVIFILTSSKFVPDALKGIAPTLSSSTIIVLGSKGILPDGTMMTRLIEENLPQNSYAVISGPTFATDIVALDPVGFTLASTDKTVFSTIASCLKGVTLEFLDDPTAIEMCGSLKNVYAIGSGILSGTNYGPSTNCLYITKALHEIEHIFTKYNLNEKALTSLAGIGDLVLTCTNINSRNYTFGTLLALKDQSAIESYLNSNTVEGYENLKAYVGLFKKDVIEAPIMAILNDIINGNKHTDDLVKMILK